MEVDSVTVSLMMKYPSSADPIPSFFGIFPNPDHWEKPTSTRDGPCIQLAMAYVIDNISSQMVIDDTMTWAAASSLQLVHCSRLSALKIRYGGRKEGSFRSPEGGIVIVPAMLKGSKEEARSKSRLEVLSSTLHARQR